MYKEYDFEDKENITYFELRKIIDQQYLEFQKNWIEQGKNVFLEKFKGKTCPSFIKREYVELGAKAAYNAQVQMLANFVPSGKGYEEMNKLFPDFNSLMIDIEKEGKKISDTIIFFIPEDEKYIYFINNVNCAEFIKNYNGIYLVEIITEDNKQNFSFIVSLEIKDGKDTINKIQKELEDKLKKFNTSPEIWLCQNNNVTWVHILNIYFKNFKEAILTIEKILGNYSNLIRYPETELQRKQAIRTWQRIIPNDRMMTDGENIFKEKILTVNDKMQIINNITVIVNNGNNPIIQTGNNNIAVTGNNNAINIPIDFGKWIDENPPLSKEGSDHYRNRLINSCKNNINSKDFAKIMKDKGYKNNKSGKCYWTK